MKDTASRAARLYRARAERCYRLARESSDFLGTEIMTGIGNGLVEKKREGWSSARAVGGGRKPEAARAA